jgi:hypothetical protein
MMSGTCGNELPRRKAAGYQIFLQKICRSIGNGLYCGVYCHLFLSLVFLTALKDGGLNPTANNFPGENLFPARRPRGAMLLFSAVFFAAAVFPLSAQKQQTDVEISVNYEFSVLNISAKYLGSESILTWRDIHLHGARLQAREMSSYIDGFDWMNLGLSFAMSSRGYHVDDDANNDFLTLSVADTDALRLDFDFSVENGGSFHKRAGINFTWVHLKNYDCRIWDDNGVTPLGLPGEVSTLYDTLTLCFYFAMATNIVETKKLYLSFSALAGPGIFAGFGNWPWRPVFKHPVSFSDVGLLARTSGEVEFGVRFNSWTLFAALLGSYEIYPFSLDIQYMANGELASQAVFTESSRFAACLGIKGAF